MKKIVILSMLVATFCLVAQPIMACTYREPTYPYDYGWKAGDCTMVYDSAEANSTQLYTLNPDHTYQLNSEYSERWGRNARCDEIQFHVDHNTPISVLSAWLDEVEKERYKNLAATRYNGNTVSTSRHEWYLIQDGVAHRIYDWLTASSWGLLIWDRITIPLRYTGDFYNSATFGDPLDFNDGPYADKIRAIWKEKDRDYSSLPTRLSDEISDFTPGSYFHAFEDCQYGSGYAGGGGAMFNLLDWDWMLTNPGCPFAD